MINQNQVPELSSSSIEENGFDSSENNDGLDPHVFPEKKSLTVEYLGEFPDIPGLSLEELVYTHLGVRGKEI